MSDVKLSVLMITYNHEHFLRQALEGVLSQEISVPFEIVIGEDCSTDGTRAIVCEYAERFPRLIRTLLPEQNLGMMANFCATLQACHGEYIAILEGDDYWTSPHKLQKQIDFLEAHPECCGSFHNVRMVHDDAPQMNRLFHTKQFSKQMFYLKDIVTAHFIPTCSTVFRARLFDKFPDWYMDMPMGDWPLHILNAQYGPYAYIDEVLAAYRVHGGGVWSSKNRLAVLDSTIVACHRIIDFLEGRYSKNIGRFTRDFEIEAAKILTEQQQYGKAALRLLSAFRVAPTSLSRTVRCAVRLLAAWLMHNCCPSKKEP